MDMAPPLLSLARVSKSYGPVKALRELTLAGAEGEFIVLLGRNGAGKSTLVQLLTGLFAPDSGTIRVIGHDLSTDAVAALRGIGIVFQQQTLDLELTVTANLLFHADLHGIPRRTARARIAEALERFGLAARASERVAALSGGNRRRLELARALLHRPRLLVMDEATVGLDPTSRRALLDHILELKESERLLVLWTTHLIDEAEIADRLLFLDRGRLVFDGTREEALRQAGSATLEDAFVRLTGEDRAASEELPAGF